jgi:hypothetical protein
MNPNNDYDCFIRRQGPLGWTRGRPHHRRAMEAFLAMPESSVVLGEPVRITVPHVDGGDFVAFFQRVNAIVCEFRDTYGGTVDIMMSSSGQAAFANRIVDYF